MVDRRSGDRRSIECQAHNPICMTIGFMFGMIVGALIHTEHSTLSVVTSVTMATAVFHFTFVRNINFTKLFSKVIKKGS
jgi:alpha/beta superfamily hydrolase